MAGDESFAESHSGQRGRIHPVQQERYAETNLKVAYALKNAHGARRSYLQ